MVEAITAGIANAFSPLVLLATLGGVVIGLIFGLVPGIAGLTAMAIIVPLSFGMEPIVALTLLIAVQAVSSTGGSVTAILFGIPGTPLNAATLIDGFPMTKKGQGGRAVGAALCASGLGGVVGGIALALLIPVAYPMVLAFASGETALVGLVGLAFIATLSREGTVRGLASGLIGIVLSFVGMQAVTGEARFTFGSLYLYEGFNLIPVVLGVFALPEIINLALRRRGTIAEVDSSALAQAQLAQVWEGTKDVFRHWALFLRASVIGTVIGLIPGVGGPTAIFVAYGHGRQSSKHPETFGQGRVEGVIAPEAANNSKEGGSMLPTLAFGIPGSMMMAVMLTGFLVHGIQPGPEMLRTHLDLTFSLVTCLIFANILGVVFLLPFIGHIAKAAFIRGTVLVPLLLALASFGAYATRTEFFDIIMMFVWGIMGYAMVKFHYNRVALVLGFILGGMVERYANIAYGAAGGFGFLLTPISLALLAVTFLMLFLDPLKGLYRVVRKRKQ